VVIMMVMLMLSRLAVYLLARAGAPVAPGPLPVPTMHLTR